MNELDEIIQDCIDGQHRAEGSFYNTKQQLLLYIKEETNNSYLSHWQYVDWEVGDDDVLRVGDWVFANKQDHNGTDVDDFTAKIVEHHDNGLPMFLTNIDPKDPDNSGDYHGIEGAWLSGYEFTRVKPTIEKNTGIVITPDEVARFRDNDNDGLGDV